MDDYEIIWMVVFCKNTVGRGDVKGIYKDYEDAKMICREMVNYHELEDNYDMFHKWEYYVRGISVREYMNERNAIYERLMRNADATFWNHCNEHFEVCCRWVLNKLRERFNPVLFYHPLRPLLNSWGRQYTPWKFFHGESRVLAYLHMDEQKPLTLTGIFLAPDDNMFKDIRQFDSTDDFKEWIGHFDDAVKEFVRVMKERRYEEYEEYLKKPAWLR